MFRSGRDPGGTLRADNLFMVITIILTSWVCFATILCFALAGVAARRRPLFGDSLREEAETLGSETVVPEFKAVCAMSQAVPPSSFLRRVHCADKRRG